MGNCQVSGENGENAGATYLNCTLLSASTLVMLAEVQVGGKERVGLKSGSVVALYRCE